MVNSTTSIRFIHIFPGIPPNVKFNLKDLPGSGKRIDVLCRGLAACFDWSPELINKTYLEYWAVFSDQLTLKFSYSPKCIGKGETWWASIIDRVISGEKSDVCSTMACNLEMVMKSTIDDGFSLYVLDEEGCSLDNLLKKEVKSQNSFMLGDHRGFESKAYELFDDMNLKRVSLGETSYLGSHCIGQIISNYERISNRHE